MDSINGLNLTEFRFKMILFWTKDDGFQLRIMLIIIEFIQKMMELRLEMMDFRLTLRLRSVSKGS